MTLLAIAVLIEVRNQVQSQFSAVTEIRREVLKIDSNALKLEMSKTYRLGKEGSRFFADYKKRLRTAVEKVIADNAGKRRVIENGSAVVLLEDSGKHIACIQPGSNLWPDPADLQEKIAAEALCFTMPSVHLVASPQENCRQLAVPGHWS
ncbi:MAG UNVERIFIED_CONTAM: hypothetical protein LVR18_32135 [Planctomycetaceae bacterium]|jgi:hypothetical protein